MTACVYLVGAGPGDPELLTIRALRLIQQADAVVYDRLVSDEILALIPKGVARVYVGKEAGMHSLPQDQTNQLLVNLARKGHRVVRLKGGDPFLYGRGGEEALFLARHGIRFEIVPGITSASACATYAGIPLIHRGVANRVQFITGHCQADQPLELDWQGLADPNLTIAVYMGLANLPQIVAGLIAAGRHADTPIAIIENGTTSRQRQLVTTLAQATQAAVQGGFQSPVMIVIGEVATLANELHWFNTETTQQQQTATETLPLAKAAGSGH
ncbi:MAG: uroporphyrinogen-III C-methyltransferase [Gammaproteobacteria bacterium]|nr:uroporphyrinogen-III C-methyltransferase [Gammaproteobacteria bacterium]MBU1723946.1 uroporphyrinogen-III C-methyltransferase [Gammaproteobacteria bacterium]MBU2007139.1 uroporphyrinogen-III C-methyltransferase [Gammaproteobacteria bacterium]